MVTARMTVVEHAKQLVSHGAHAADIEVVEGLLAELEKSKKAIESLRELTRKQFGLVRMSEPLQPSPDMITDVINEVRKLQDAAHEFEVFRNQWKVDNPDLADPTEEGLKFEYLNNANEPFIMNGGAEAYMALPTPTRHAWPPREHHDNVVPVLSRSQESNS